MVDIDIEMHPSIHNVSKTHDVRVMMAQQEFDLMWKLINDPDLPYKAMSDVVREAVHSYCTTVVEAKEVALPPALQNWLSQQRATSRWLTMKEAREANTRMLRMARDELVQMIKDGDEAKMEKAYRHIEGTLKDLFGADKEYFEVFIGLPVVRYIRQWKEGPPADGEVLPYNYGLFISENGIP